MVVTDIRMPPSLTDEGMRARVGKHVGNVFAKLGLPPTQEVNRRVPAVLTYPRTT